MRDGKRRRRKKEEGTTKTVITNLDPGKRGPLSKQFPYEAKRPEDGMVIINLYE
jgi:hypothetical protein